MNKQNEMIKDLANTTVDLKDEFIESQQSVIRLQDQLIASKDEQMLSLQNTVKASMHSVQETVKEELKSYSSVVKGQGHFQTVSPQTLKTVVQKVVEQEDRSRNVMLFGLQEEADESAEALNGGVVDLFAAIGEKPRFEANRIGKTDAPGKPARAVKVTLSSAAIVHQLLIKARKLKVNEDYAKVFVCPDLSLEQRTERRQLVLERKRLAVEKPAMRHFIRDGKVESVEKA